MAVKPIRNTATSSSWFNACGPNAMVGATAISAAYAERYGGATPSSTLRLTFARTREGGILTVTAGHFAGITSYSGASRFLTVRPSIWTPGCITILISGILAQQRRHRPHLHRLGPAARLVEVIRQVPSHETKAFYNLGCTAGAYLVFPVQTQVDGK